MTDQHEQRAVLHRNRDGMWEEDPYLAPNDGVEFMPVSEHESVVARLRVRAEQAEAELARVTKAARDLADAVEFGLDLSDDYALEGATPETILSASRPLPVWLRLREAVEAVRAAVLSENKEGG